MSIHVESGSGYNTTAIGGDAAVAKPESEYFDPKFARVKLLDTMAEVSILMGRTGRARRDAARNQAVGLHMQAASKRESGAALALAGGVVGGVAGITGGAVGMRASVKAGEVATGRAEIPEGASPDQLAMSLNSQGQSQTQIYGSSGELARGGADYMAETEQAEASRTDANATRAGQLADDHTDAIEGARKAEEKALNTIEEIRRGEHETNVSIAG